MTEKTTPLQLAKLQLDTLVQAGSASTETITSLASLATGAALVSIAESLEKLVSQGVSSTEVELGGRTLRQLHRSINPPNVIPQQFHTEGES